MEGDFEEIWRSGNSWWRLEPGRAVRCDLGLVLTPDNVVACVAKINGIIKRDDMRMGFIGKQPYRLLRRASHPPSRQSHQRH